MAVSPLPFPQQAPATYRPLADEPHFDPTRHLALGAPQRTWTLADFGYDAATIAATPSPIAAAGPFRILSDEGVAALAGVCRALGPERTDNAGDKRTASYVAGAVYRSAFLRDLCASPEIADHLTAIAGTRLLPHTAPSLQLYINYAPQDLAKAVDNWHVDSIGFDYVLMASDPAPMKGGRFQIFRGTLDEAARLLATTPGRLTDGFLDDLPAERVESFTFPAAGWAVFQQGHLVLHRATRLEQPAERITLVPGYVAADMRGADPTLVERIVGWGEPGQLAELARHAAWLGQAKLAALADDLAPDADAATLTDRLRRATADVERLVASLERLGDASG